jgi:thymidine kinase
MPHVVSADEALSVFNKGGVVVVRGPMYSGKTTYCLERVIPEARRRGVALHVYRFDTPSRALNSTSHRGTPLPEDTVFRETPEAVAEHLEALTLVPDGRTVAVVIDEVSLFLLNVGEQRVVAALERICAIADVVFLCGLRYDFRRQPIVGMDALANSADCVVDFKACCAVCACPDAEHSELLGDTGRFRPPFAPLASYRPACAACHRIPPPAPAPASQSTQQRQ